MFEAMPQALLEIHTGMMASAILSDTIPCYRLQLQEEEESEPVSEAISTGLGFSKVAHETRAAVSAVAE